MNYRHEHKHMINTSDFYELRHRLRAVLKHDMHGHQGTYIIRSLYFDDLNDTALKEKINGVNNREKFRLRFYDYDDSFIRLEKKSKMNGLCMKVSCPMTKAEVQALLSGDIDWMMTSSHKLMQELYVKMKNRGLKPKTIVEYTREAFIYRPGNVRITLDFNIRTGLSSIDFLNPNLKTTPVRDHPMILEVKWDEYLPDVIKDLVALNGRQASAFSKYAACRMYD